MQTDGIGLLCSAMYAQRVLLCQEITRQTGTEAGFHCCTNGVSTILNIPVGGGAHSMRNHLQGDEGFLYTENEGFYEGLDSQILIFTHTHPGTGRNAFRPRILEITPSFADIFSLYCIARQNLKIAEDIHVEPWINPIAVVAEKEQDDVFICQLDRSLVEKIWDEDLFYDHVAETLNGLFEKWYPKKRQRAVWDGILIGLHYSMGSEATPSFVTSSQKRCLDFYASLGLTCKIVSLRKFNRPDTLAMFQAPAVPPSDGLEEVDEYDDDEEWDYGGIHFG